MIDKRLFEGRKAREATADRPAQAAETSLSYTRTEGQWSVAQAERYLLATMPESSQTRMAVEIVAPTWAELKIPMPVLDRTEGPYGDSHYSGRLLERTEQSLMAQRCAAKVNEGHALLFGPFLGDAAPTEE